MEDKTFESLKLQYEEGTRIIRYWIETRYKILQFIGYFNAAVMTFGFSQKILLDKTNSLAGLAISILAIFVSLMGLATEFSVTSYNYGYFDYLRKLEEKLIGKKDGIFTHSRDLIVRNQFHKILPVHRAHKLFYGVLVFFWIGISIYQITLQVSF